MLKKIESSYKMTHNFFQTVLSFWSKKSSKHGKRLRKQKNELMMLYKLKTRKEKGTNRSSLYYSSVKCKIRRKERIYEEHGKPVKQTKLC